MKKIIGAGLFFAPFLAFAAQLAETATFIEEIGKIIDVLTPLVFALALLYFFWGLAQFILASGSDEAKTEGKNKMIWGVIVLFVMATIFGLIGFIQRELGVDDESTTVESLPSVPSVPR